MAQHDYDINSSDAISGLQFRQDLNACLSAIKSGNAGATEPATPTAGMVWFDTSVSPAVFRQRNSGNTAWVLVGSDGTMGVSLAAAATTTIGGQMYGDTIVISGNTAITSFGVSSTGTKRTLILSGTPTITHNGTSLICPGGASIVCIANTIIDLVCIDGTLSYWEVTSVQHPDVSFTELGYLDGVTSAIQTQLNAKAASATTVAKDSATGVAYYPAGTTAERPVLADTVVGVRYNTTLGAEEIGIGTTGATTWKVLSDTSHTHATYLALAGGTMTGAITALRETKVAMGANDINLAAGNLFTKTIAGITTLTVSNWLASGNANSFILELTNGGAFAVTWFAGVKWASGVAPTLTAAGIDILGFYSHDGGTTVRGILLAKDSK